MKENSFKGILSDVSSPKLKTRIIKIALTRNVITEIDLYAEDFNFNNIVRLAMTWSDFFCYYSKTYKLNSDIIDEIANVIIDVISKEDIEVFKLDKEEVEIRKSIFSIKENNKFFQKK